MNVIYVDDESIARESFEYEAKSIREISRLDLFERADAALSFARKNRIDAAFLDIEMPDMSGLLLAKALREIQPDICIVFVTAYSTYAMEAFNLDAIGYVLKPYDGAAIVHALKKAARMIPQCERKIKIQTIPTFMMTIDGKPVQFSSSKSEELLALLVDRAGRAMMPGEIISCLWPDRMMDEKTTALLRMTYRRLVLQLRSIGVEDILLTQGKRRSLDTEKLECDLYQILNGDEHAASRYSGEYLREYSWAEMTNAMLDKMSYSNVKKQTKLPESMAARKPKKEEQPEIFVHTFGRFEVFHREIPLRFKYERSRELLAYLIDRSGAYCTKAEVAQILFHGEPGHDAYLKKLREDVINAFESCGCGECLIKQRGRLAVNRRMVRCDFYAWLDGETPAEKNSFHGEYMSQYAWAERTRNALREEQALRNR